MKWTRERPGVYTAGPYIVKRLLAGSTTWRATGPGMAPEINWRGKDLAQDECRRVAAWRAADPNVEPIIGDIVVTLADKRRGQITMMLKSGATNPAPLWCIKFARGRRLCLLRHEFEVVMP